MLILDGLNYVAQMGLSAIAVPHTLAHLMPLLPSPPARIAEAGCGDGALAAALGNLGFDVTGVDRNHDAAQAAREQGVHVVEADINMVTGEYDVILFTRSLHHAESLDDTLAHAALLAPGGQIIIEEFAWERVDDIAAEFLYGCRSDLVEAGLLDADLPSGDLLDAWTAGHQDLHRGSTMLRALDRLGSNLTTIDTSILWRLLDGRGGTWIASAGEVDDALSAVRRTEERRLAAGDLPFVGLIAAIDL